MLFILYIIIIICSQVVAFFHQVLHCMLVLVYNVSKDVKNVN